MTRTVKLSLFCAGIFVCGAVAGGFAARKCIKPVKPPQEPTQTGGPQDGFGPQQLRRFSAELDLTEPQKAALLPILEKTGEELRQLRRESFRQTSAVIEAMEASVAELLTPAQREKLAVLQAEQRARMKARMEERNRRKAEGGERREGENPERRPEGSPPSPPVETAPPPTPASS
jgi:Spy/CpxP family protein refolding chaperone